MGEVNVPVQGIVIGVMSLSEAKRIQSSLEEWGVGAWLVSNPHTCTTGGCTPTVELHAPEDKIERVREFLASEKERMHEGLEFDSALLDEVYDPEKGTARCPACGEGFSTSLTECPGCGLGFGGA